METKHLAITLIAQPTAVGFNLKWGENLTGPLATMTGSEETRVTCSTLQFRPNIRAPAPSTYKQNSSSIVLFRLLVSCRKFSVLLLFISHKHHAYHPVLT